MADSERIGIDQALREHYRVDGLTGLQREWDEWVGRPDAMEFVSLQLHVGKGATLARFGDHTFD